MDFQKATKKQSKLRMALVGPSGSGKTYTALAVATNLGKRVAVIDTERGSASKYSDIFSFDVLELETFSPDTYVEAIAAAASAGYDVLVIDSLSHAWMGKDGALEQVDRAQKRSQSGNSFAAWRDVTPMHNRLVDAMIQARLHIIATMRAKTEYVVETNERGKQVPRKVGMAPVQRDGLEYEFDVVGDMTLENDFVVSKTRCSTLQGQIIAKPNKPLADTLKAWLEDGLPAPEPKPQPKAAIVVFDDTLPEMTLETANAVTNSEGKLYCEIDSETLAHMANALRRKVTEGKATDEQKYKLSAAQVILASRNS